MTPRKSKRENFLLAVRRLAEGLEEYAASPTTTARDGVIQRFEFTIELAWKSLKEYLEDQGFSPEYPTPKAVLKQAYASGIISDQSVWIDMIDARNHTSHMYSDSQASAVMSSIQKSYIGVLQKLAHFFEQE